jgi:ubiquinone/menaquinone biosynthesis C-methylase UbiE
MREYDLIADWYWTDRGRTVGVAEALAVAATLPAGSRILDIGCGNGVPITAALVKAGQHVVGLDHYGHDERGDVSLLRRTQLSRAGCGAGLRAR